MAGFGDSFYTQAGAARDPSDYYYQREGQTETGGIRIECGCFCCDPGFIPPVSESHFTRLFCAIGFLDDSVCATETFGMVHAKSLCSSGGGTVIEWSVADNSQNAQHANYIAFGM